MIADALDEEGLPFGRIIGVAAGILEAPEQFRLVLADGKRAVAAGREDGPAQQPGFIRVDPSVAKHLFLDPGEHPGFELGRAVQRPLDDLDGQRELEPADRLAAALDLLDQPGGIGQVDIALGLLAVDDMVAQSLEEEVGPFGRGIGGQPVDLEQGPGLVVGNPAVGPHRAPHRQHVLGGHSLPGLQRGREIGEGKAHAILPRGFGADPNGEGLRPG